MAIKDWGSMVAMPTPGIGVVLHYVEGCDEHVPGLWMRASCGLEAEGVILDWFDHLPRNTKTCDYCFVSLPARGPSTEVAALRFPAWRASRLDDRKKLTRGDGDGIPHPDL